MRLALVTTTINVPTVLKLYRACDPDVMFFITGDRKSPDHDIVDFLQGVPNHFYYGADWQSKLGYKCSDLIGWGTISRRCIAILEALKWGADIIVTCDDDNIPLTTDYFAAFEHTLTAPFNGVGVKGHTGWFDPGKLLLPPAPHRGFPHDVRSLWGAVPIDNVRVGVAAGMCLGDPDISACERIINHPDVHGVSELLRAGIVVDTQTWTVFNSQNTAFVRELAPAFLLCPQFGRYDDIVASLIVQRVMRERDMHVHFGQPLVHQARNPHNLLNDLDAETWGMRNVARIAEFLDTLKLSRNGSVSEHVASIYDALFVQKWIPEGTSALGQAWLGDIKQVMG